MIVNIKTFLKKCLLFSLCFGLSFLPLSPALNNNTSIVSISYASMFKDFSISDEKKLGREFEILVKSRLPLVEDPEIKLYIVSLMEEILENVPPQPFNFEANVVYSPALNAFASPGGFIFIFTGLLVELENEAQLAGIMAHEIAHVTQRHIAARIDKGKFLSFATIAGMLAGALSGSGEASQAIVSSSAAFGQSAQLNYSRMDENDADRFGLQYLIKSGYSPNGLAEGFEILQNNSLGIGADFPTYLSTHPDLNARIVGVRAYIRSMPKDIKYKPISNERFLRAKALTMAYFADSRHAQNYFSSKKSALNTMGLGIIASKRNQIKTAATHFEKALKMDPNDSLILREAGRFYYEKGDPKIAHKYLIKALEINPDDYMAMFFYARLLDTEKRYAEAQSFYLQVLKYAPEDTEVYSLYGRSLGKSGKEFEGYLALAYAAIYSNREGRALSWLARATKLAQSDTDNVQIKKARTVLAERKNIGKK